MEQQKLLIVDDEEANIDVLVSSLADEYELAVAIDGQKALELASTFSPDLILLDIMMPGIDGYEVCRQLKVDPNTATIPVIFVTAMAEMENEAQGLGLGAVDYITKPVSPPILKARVQTHLQLKRQHDRLKESSTRMEHEAKILQHKAELGIHAGCLAHDIGNILFAVMHVQFLPDYIAEGVPGREELVEDVLLVKESLRLGCDICQGYTNFLQNIDEGNELQPFLPLLQPLDMYSRKFKGTLEKDFAADLPLLSCRGAQLKRVFINLFINATQALEGQNEQKIHLRVWEQEGQIFFRIRDNGPGIARENLARIFDERFTTKVEGIGLGLFLSKQIVEFHKGSIEVQSEPGKGTAFTLSLPAITD